MANGGIIGTVNNPTSSTATGVWQQEEQYEAVRDGTWPQRALFTTKSARFNSASSDYMTKSNSSTGSTTKATISMWIKFSSVLTNQALWENYSDGSNYLRLRYRSDASLAVQVDLSNSTDVLKITTRKFRDTSAWYHIVLAINLADGTQEDKYILYINGVRETSFSTNNNTANTSGNYVGGGNGFNFTIGRHPSSDAYYDGYMSEYVFVDGQNLAPTSFGVANSSGFWSPIPYAGTFGTNGFNLQFENAAALGTDSSPNSNTFTVNNLTSIDQTTDYPEINFATANPLNVNSGAVGTFTDGNLTIKVANSTGSQFGSSSTIGASSGKWYCEVKIITVDSCMIGVTPSPSEDARNNRIPEGSSSSGSVGCLVDSGNKYVSGNGTTYGAATSANGIMMIALDLDNLKVYFGSGGQWANGSGAWNQSGLISGAAISITAVASTAEGAYFFSFGDGGGSAKAKVSWNFGNAPYAISSGNADANGYGNFEYAPPSGYYSLNTANLAEFG